MAQTPEPSKVTDAEFNALVQRVQALEVEVVALGNDVQAIDARVTSLEEDAGTPPVDPPIDPPVDLQPSPDGATATAPGVVLVSAALNALELVAAGTGQNDWSVAINGVRDPITHDVLQLYAKSGFIYQQAQDWWKFNDTDGSWSYTQDPTKPQPIPPDPVVPPDTGDLPPVSVGGLVGLYTCGRGASQTWNWGTGNDQELSDSIDAWNQEAGVEANAYGFFPLWGSMEDWPGNLGWAVYCMTQHKQMTPIVGLRFFWQGVPPAYYGWNDLQGLKDCANGRWDHVWQACVDECAGKVPQVIWRLSYEGNFSFMPDFCGWDATSQAEWVKAFNRQASVILDQSAKKGLSSIICFNPSLGRGSAPIENILPDPSLYHWFCCDAYNGYYGDGDIHDDAERRRFWTEDYYAWNQHLDFARQIGKPVMVCENGAGERPDGHGFANSANFWRWQSDMASATREAGVPFTGSMFWDVPAGDLNGHFSNGAQPPCMEAVRQYLQDGTLVGDATDTAIRWQNGHIQPAKHDAAADRAWVEAHPEFVEMMKRRVHDVIDRARGNVGMRA